MTIAAGGRRHIQITSILFAVAIITVLFRFVSHRRARTSPRADDWTLLAAVAFVFAVYVEGLVWVVYGGIGKHMTELSPEEISTLLKCSFLSWLTYALAFVLTKISILLLYIRIFPVRNLRIACAVVGALVALLGAGIFAVGFAQCRPFRYIWDKSVASGRCVPAERVFYGTAVSSLLLNTAVVALPMPVLWGLQMKRRHKVALILVFSLGGLVCVAGIIRIWTIKTLDPADLSYTITTAAILIAVEPSVAIISICLPAIQPVLRDIASYSTIEYLKLLCRIKTAIDPDPDPDPRPSSVERVLAKKEKTSTGTTTETTRRSGVGGGGCARARQNSADGVMEEVSSEYEDGDEDVFPTEKVRIGGWVMGGSV